MCEMSLKSIQRFMRYLENSTHTERTTILVFNVVSRFVEPVRLFPASVKAHGAFVLQQFVHAAQPGGWSTSETLLLRVTNLTNGVIKCQTGIPWAVLRAALEPVVILLLPTLLKP